MKKIISIFACTFLLISCHQSKEGIVKDLLEAENNFQIEKLSQFLTDSFVCYGTDTLGKEAFLARLEANKLAECQISLLNIQDLDSIVKTEEQLSTIIDVPLEIAPLIVQKKTYRFSDNKLVSITFDSVLNLDEYTKSFDEKTIPFIFWVKDQYDIKDEMEILANIKKYLPKYTNLPISEKKQYKNYAHLQGTYVSKDCTLYKKLIFKGKRTVTIIDAIFGFPFATSYELDEDLVKIRTDQSDLLFEIKDSQTLIGEGFASGTFIKAN